MRSRLRGVRSSPGARTACSGPRQLRRATRCLAGTDPGTWARVRSAGCWVSFRAEVRPAAQSGWTWRCAAWRPAPRLAAAGGTGRRAYDSKSAAIREARRVVHRYACRVRQPSDTGTGIAALCTAQVIDRRPRTVIQSSPGAATTGRRWCFERLPVTAEPLVAGHPVPGEDRGGEGDLAGKHGGGADLGELVALPVP